MSATSLVPALVPSVRQSSFPVLPSLALKYSAPFATVSAPGFEPSLPGSRSLKSVVPAVVPSLRHSS